MATELNGKPARVPAKRFEDLIVWQKAHRFVLQLYGASAQFPKAEMHGLTSQVRRSAISVPANIAEGFKRQGKPEKARFLNIAEASLDETRYYLILARDLGYLTDNRLMELLEEVDIMLWSYRDRILASR